jgi:hypothetical protein
MNEMKNTTVGIHMLGYLSEEQVQDARGQGKQDDFMHLIGYLEEKHFEETTKLFAKKQKALDELYEIAIEFDKRYGTDMKLVVAETKDFLFSE